LLSPNKLVDPNTPYDVRFEVLKVNPDDPNRLPPVLLPNNDPPVAVVAPPKSEPVAGPPKRDVPIEGAPNKPVDFFSSFRPSPSPFVFSFSGLAGLGPSKLAFNCNFPDEFEAAVAGGTFLFTLINLYY
jgi:hypothetical protein